MGGGGCWVGWGGQGGLERRIVVFFWGGGDVNAMLGVGGDVGSGGCEPRIEGIVQCTNRYCTILTIKKI